MNRKLKKKLISLDKGNQFVIGFHLYFLHAVISIFGIVVGKLHSFFLLDIQSRSLLPFLLANALNLSTDLNQAVNTTS